MVEVIGQFGMPQMQPVEVEIHSEPEEDVDAYDSLSEEDESQEDFITK
jgi:hypothetical protein